LSPFLAWANTPCKEQPTHSAPYSLVQNRVRFLKKLQKGTLALGWGGVGWGGGLRNAPFFVSY